MREATFVIVGGGIAGVSCAEGLSFLAPEESMIVISASPTVKKVTNVRNLTKLLSEFNVEEEEGGRLSEQHPNIEVIHGAVVALDHENSLVKLGCGEEVRYERLCICSGASPKLIGGVSSHIVGIRDTDSVEDFRQRLSQSRRVVVVGNGGIATELVHESSGVDLVWVIKDQHISATFVDPGAAQFFQTRLLKRDAAEEEEKIVSRLKYTTRAGGTGLQGAALGPDWHSSVDLRGLLQNTNLSLERGCEVRNVLGGDDDWPVRVELTNDKIIGCDLIVSATGVVPNVDIYKQAGAVISEDGGLKVNWKMQTSLANVYAAGDAATAGWSWAPQWVQMRLWTQARQMGTYAAKAMTCDIRGEELLQDFCFELFTHATKLFGMKVILLGLFNGQTLDSEYEVLLRVTQSTEYVKLILKGGRLQGAVLIGDTDLEEMCENLILNQLDLTSFGDDLLNPDIDIDDFFD